MPKQLKNPRWLTTLTKLQTYLLYGLPVVIFFSYYPVIPLGASDTMNFELSLPMLWLLLFALLSLPTLPYNIKSLKVKPWQISLLALFPCYLVLSLIWTANLTRGVLTAGVFGCLVLAALSFPRLIKTQTQKRRLIKIFLGASLAVAVFCWIQSVLDVAGFPTTQTLACQGCTTNTFGFPHPNGFAIEPQFMGNLLLAPALLSLYLCLHAHLSRRRRAQSLGLALFFSTTLFFTFSRGAIYAYLLAGAFVIIAGLIKQRRTPQRFTSLLIIPVLLSSLLLSLSLQGLFAGLSPTTDDFWSGVTKSIHHLTLGKIDLRPTPTVVENTTEKQAATSTTDDSNANTKPNNTDAIQPTFDGYVEQSTDFRLHLTQSSLATWRQTPQTIMLGTGIGSTGVALYQAGYTAHPKEITQNQYTEILLELGLVGAALVLLAIIAIATIIKHQHIAPYTNIYLFALLLAYAITLGFFSGLPNAPHIYLLPPLLFLLAKN